jgi:hypothetical protein
MAYVSAAEIESAKKEFIATVADSILSSDPLLIFSEMDDGGESVIRSLMSGSMLELINLQETFCRRMRHEAEAYATRRWTASEEARAIHRIQDEGAEQ